MRGVLGHRGTVSRARGDIWGARRWLGWAWEGIWGYTEVSGVHGSLWDTQGQLKCLEGVWGALRRLGVGRCLGCMEVFGVHGVIRGVLRHLG